MSLTRSGDRWKTPATIAGFVILIIFAAIALFLPHDRQPSEGVKYVLLALGAGLISPTFVVDLLRVWRGSSNPPAGPPE